MISGAAATTTGVISERQEMRQEMRLRKKRKKDHLSLSLSLAAVVDCSLPAASHCCCSLPVVLLLAF